MGYATIFRGQRREFLKQTLKGKIAKEQEVAQ